MQKGTWFILALVMALLNMPFLAFVFVIIGLTSKD